LLGFGWFLSYEPGINFFNTLDGGADEVDLGLQVDGWEIICVLGGCWVVGRIIAMLAGILVTGLATATTYWRGGSWHILIIETGFFQSSDSEELMQNLILF
jgi:hypothetical protein